MWRSGSASPCQGEGREFESRHPLGEASRWGSPAVVWPRGEAAACKAVYTGSNPVATSDNSIWAIGAAVARFPDTEEVTGSNPVSPTTQLVSLRAFDVELRVFFASAESEFTGLP